MEEAKDGVSYLETLKKYWGFDSFRPKQLEIIQQAAKGNDVLAILPTGGGKSLCFQVPSMMKEGICIVVSPLIALMKDQVENLKKRGIKALAVYSGMMFREIDITLDNAIYGDYKFLYVSPERLRTELFRVRASKMNVNYIVVDEAHCISQWGYDFRPDYLQIKEIRAIFPGVPVIALTATATPSVSEDIMRQLGFKKDNLIVSGFERPNLSYSVRKAENKLGQLLKVCNGVPGSAIVYVGKRKNAEDVAGFLNANGIDAAAYHAGMNRDVRTSIQDEWKHGKKRIIVSTNAFGMGIDKPDVRFVCHYEMPSSPEAYFQEAGRAGRDGKKAYAVMIWNDTDIARLRQINKTAYPPLDYIKEVYQKVFQFLKIPYEEGAGVSMKFDLEKFAREFHLHSATAYYAVKYIEMAGKWTLIEELDVPSKVNVLVGRDELYGIQLGSVETDTFLKVLMRMYTGLFSGYISIDEEKIAKFGHYSPLAVAEKLRKLSNKGIIKYIPKFRSPLLNFNEERIYEKNLRLPQKDYDDRVGRALERSETMIKYVTENDICRSQMLLAYFGQKESKPCGICDVCLSGNGK